MAERCRVLDDRKKWKKRRRKKMKKKKGRKSPWMRWWSKSRKGSACAFVRKRTKDEKEKKSRKRARYPMAAHALGK